MFLQRTGENSFLVRTHHNDPQLALLFELCVVFKKKAKAQATEDQTGELCCGWCSLPLFQPTQGTTPGGIGVGGTPGNDKLLEFRTYELALQGGTPFDEYHFSKEKRVKKRVEERKRRREGGRREKEI